MTQTEFALAVSKAIKMPGEDSELVSRFMTEHLPNGEAVTVYVSPSVCAFRPFADECFDNVSRQVRTKGGCEVLGWTLWEWSGKFLKTEAHVCWKSKDEQLIDITPKQDKKIMFVPDARVIAPSGKSRVPSLYIMANPDDQEVARYIELQTRVAMKLPMRSGGIISTEVEDMMRQAAKIERRWVTAEDSGG